MRTLTPTFILVVLACVVPACAASASVPIYDVDVVHTYPHDVSAYTEGLFYLNGFLYESTGLEQHSTIRKVRI
jgi:glutamine cyclotransferase